VLFRSLRSLAGRTLAADAASAVALTLFIGQCGTLIFRVGWGCGWGGALIFRVGWGCGQRGTPIFRFGYAPPSGGRARDRVGEGRPDHNLLHLHLDEPDLRSGGAAGIRGGQGGQGAVRRVLVARPRRGRCGGDDVAADAHQGRLVGVAGGRAGCRRPDALAGDWDGDGDWDNRP
jgi:hypothetical protein